MSQITEQEKQRLFDILNAQSKQLDRLEKGMFGDEKLKIPGLISDMIVVKDWIVKYKLKIAFVSGIFTTIGFLITKVWEYLTHQR